MMNNKKKTCIFKFCFIENLACSPFHQQVKASSLKMDEWLQVILSCENLIALIAIIILIRKCFMCIPAMDHDIDAP